VTYAFLTFFKFCKAKKYDEKLAEFLFLQEL